MQHRASALYVAFFLVIATGSYTGLALMEEPTPSVENPQNTLAVNDTFEVDDRDYTVTDISAEINNDGNLERSGTAQWVNQSARYTATWENNSTVSLQNETYRVLISNVTDPSSVTLQEELNRTAILRNDSRAENEVVTFSGTAYVVRVNDETRELVPADDYFPTPSSTEYSEGETLDYNGNTTTVTNVTQQSVTLTWTAPRTNTVELGTTIALETMLVRGGTPTNLDYPAGTNATLNSVAFAAHYPDNSTVVLSSTPANYQQQITTIQRSHERISGLWGVFILSSFAGLLLIGLSCLPTRR